MLSMKLILCKAAVERGLRLSTDHRLSAVDLFVDEIGLLDDFSDFDQERYLSFVYRGNYSTS